MAQFTLPRSGDRPLTFEGEEIARVVGESVKGKGGARWHELTLYQQPGGPYIVLVVYCTTWDQESDHWSAWVCEAIQDVVAKLQTHDPADPVRGYPSFPQFAAKQEALFRDIRARYEKAVSDLLADLPEVLE